MKKIASIKGSCTNKRMSIFYDEERHILCDCHGEEADDVEVNTEEEARKVARKLWSWHGWEYREF